MMRRLLLSFIILQVFMLSHAQTDSTYILALGHRLTIRPYMSKTVMSMTHDLGSGAEILYIPNDSPKFGLGLSINNTIISFGFGYGFNFLTDKKYGKTEALDFQLHHYGRKIVYDVYFQKFKGFYEQDSKDVVRLYPDMRIRQYGAYGHYVFNHKRYSYVAAFNRDEKQLKSAGSFLLGGGLYRTRISSDSSFVYNGRKSLKNFQFGISAGYAYTWVLGRHWDVSVSATAGVNVDRLDSKMKVYPTVFPRFSAGYTVDDWSLGASYTRNLVFPLVSEVESIRIDSGVFQLFFVKRFNLIPFIGNRVDGLLDYF